MSCHSTPFLWCLPKETVSSRQRKALFYLGGSTIRVSATASVVVTHLRPTWGGAGGLTGRSSQLDAVGGDVGASSPWERRAGPNSCRGGTQKRVSLGLHPVSLRKSKEMGWNGQGQRGLLPNKTAHTYKAKDKAASSLGFCVCAVTLGGGRYPLLPFDPISLVLAQRNGVEPPKKSAFLPWWLHHPRERCQSVDYTFLARLWAGAGAGRGGVRVTAQKEGPPDGGLSSQYLKSCAFSRTMSLTFMRRTLVEFSFSSSFMVM